MSRRYQTPAKANLLEFAKTGCLGPLKLELPLKEATKILGAPPKFVTMHNFPGSFTWFISDLVIQFNDYDLLSCISSYSGQLNYGGTRLVIDPWIIRYGLTLKEFTSTLKRLDIGFGPITQVLGNDENVTVTVNKVTTFEFEPKADTTFGEFGLVSWRTSPEECKKLFEKLYKERFNKDRSPEPQE